MRTSLSVHQFTVAGKRCSTIRLQRVCEGARLEISKSRTIFWECGEWEKLGATPDNAAAFLELNFFQCVTILISKPIRWFNQVHLNSMKPP
jgi:hypothetical protein